MRSEMVGGYARLSYETAGAENSVPINNHTDEIPMEQSLLETVRYALGVVRRRWLLFTLSVVVISAISLIVAVVLPPVYVSSARILVESQQIPEEFVRSSVTSAANERIQVIQQRVMTRSNLMSIARKFKMLENELKGYSSTQIVEYMRKRLNISRYALEEGTRRRRSDSTTIAFTVSFENKSPQRAASITNELVTLILAEDARTRRTRASDTSKFLAEEAKRLEKELALLEGQIATYREENKTALPERLAFNLSEMSSLRSKLSQVKNDHRKALEDKKIAQLELDGRLSGSISSGRSVAVDPKQAQLQALETELGQAKAIYSPSHPRRKLLESRIETLKKQIQEDEESAAKAASEENKQADLASAATENPDQNARPSATLEILQDRINRYVEMQAELQKRNDQLALMIAKTPQVELGLTTLSRRLEINKAKLQDMWRKYADAQLGERLEETQKGERFEVIEQPTVPTEPERPNRLLVFGLGIFVAFGVGGAGMVLPELLDPSIRSVGQLTAGLGIRPLVVVPFFITPEERKIRRRRRAKIAFIIFLLFAAGLAAVHFLYMPIDLLISKVIQRFQVQL